ncbi:MAG: ChaN family lipoprotein [bacterium]|nr:ChaN family lipoprotein [bacterium]
MKKIFFQIIIFLIIFSSCTKNVNINVMKDIKIVETSSLKEIKFTEFIEKISTYDIVLFGERHDDSLTHQLELITFKEFVNKNERTALSLEMFERDVQSLLDSFLSDKIDEQKFLNNSRPWNNYYTDYRPLLLLAKEKGLPVIASNIPRKFASIISKSGRDSLYKIENIKDLFFEPAVDLKSYKERFFDFFSSMMQSSPMANLNKDNAYISQLFKDATMAGSIRDFVNRNKGYKVFHLCGEFHSNYYLGIYPQLQQFLPEKRILTIAVVDDSTFDPTIADFLFVK